MKNYLINITLGDLTKQERTQALLKIKEAINILSGGKNILAHNNPEATIIGILAQIDKPAAVIKSILDGSNSPTNPRTPRIQSALTNADKIYVIEIANDCDFSEKGHNTLLPWLKKLKPD